LICRLVFSRRGNENIRHGHHVLLGSEHNEEEAKNDRMDPFYDHVLLVLVLPHHPQRWRDLILAHASDLGGPEVLSEAQISICRRSAAIEVALEQIEARMSEGQQIDLDQYGRLTGRLCRIWSWLVLSA